MGQNYDEESMAKYIMYIFVLFAVASLLAGAFYFGRADGADAEWRAGMESGTMSYEHAWNLVSIAMSYRGIGIALYTAAAAFFGTGMAFYLQSRPRKSDAILTTQLQAIRRELLIMQEQLQRVVELLRS